MVRISIVHECRIILNPKILINLWFFQFLMSFLIFNMTYDYASIFFGKKYNLAHQIIITISLDDLRNYQNLHSALPKPLKNASFGEISP
jgi:hypothetical protein